MTPPTKCLRLSAIVLFFFSALALQAEEKPTPIPDYQAAHSALIALGLPALTPEAKWITLPQERSYNNSKLELQTKGNHWLISSSEEKFHLALGSVVTIKLPTDPKKSEPKEADLKADIAAVHKALKKFKSQPSDELRYAFEYYGGSQSLAQVLIFAAQVRQAGHPELANALTHETLNATPGKQEAIIDAAISLIADAKYKEYTDQFSKDHNWTTYHQNLLSLITRFPRGWSNSDAVALCLEPTAQRAKGTVPAVSTITDPALASLADALLQPPSSGKKPDDANTFHGVDLSQYPAQHREQIKAQLMQMLAQGMPLPTSRSENIFPSLWLLTPIEKSDDSSPINQLLSKGIHALPVLAALAEDPTLTHILTSSRSDNHSFRSYGGSAPSALQLHAALHRPISRGELATRLLQNTLPDPSNDIPSIPAADIAQFARDFWKLHKDKKDWELAIPFLNGDHNQRRQALQLLSESKSPEALAIFKKTALQSSNTSDIGLVFEFIRANPEEDPQFIDDYKKVLLKLAASPPNRNEYYGEDYADSIKANIKKIEALTSQQKPEDLINEILAGKPEEANAAVETLLELFEGKPATDTVLLLLNAALKATDPAITSAFIQGTYSLEFEHESPTRPISEKERALWKKLLDDKRALPKNEEQEDDIIYTVANIAAAGLCYTYSEQEYYAARQWAPILKKTLEEILQARSNAIANGEPLPAWPDADKVSEQRLTEIVKSIDQKTPTEILAVIDQLTPDETAAWFKWLATPGDLPHPESLKQLKFLINARSKDYKNYITDDPQIDKLTLPFHITTDSLIKWLDTLAADMPKLSRSTIIISPNRETRLDLNITAGKITLPTPQKNDSEQVGNEDEQDDFEETMYQFLGSASNALEEDEEADAAAVINLTLQGRRSKRIMLTSTLKNGKITKGDDFTSEKITEFLTAAAEVGFSEPLYIQVQILSREDYTKIQQHLEGDGEEEDDEDMIEIEE